jgi:hypothetical protein
MLTNNAAGGHGGTRAVPNGYASAAFPRDDTAGLGGRGPTRQRTGFMEAMLRGLHIQAAPRFEVYSLGRCPAKASK